MTEQLEAEVLQEEDGEKGELTEVQQVPEISAAEEKARAQGWRPIEEWEGGEDTWVDFKEFNHRGELLDRIKSQTSKIKAQDSKIDELGKAMQTLGEHNQRIAEMEYKKALSELRDQRTVAMSEQDFDMLQDIEDQIEELKELDPKKQPVSPSINLSSKGSPPPELDRWMEDNTWYRQDPAMRGAADQLAIEYVKANPSARGNPQVVLDHITSEIKKRFSADFSNKQTKPRSAVSESQGTSRSSSKATRYTSKHLNETQAKMAKTFVDSGALKSVQEYVNQLADLGDLEAQQQ
jgi:hypothetical protein